MTAELNLWVHFPKGWARLKSGARNPILVSHVSSRDQRALNITCYLPRGGSREVHWKWVSRTAGTPVWGAA